MLQSEEEVAVAGNAVDSAAAIEADLRDRFPKADLKVVRYPDHLDVRVVPTDLTDDLEQAHDGTTVTPYSAFKMTIQLET